MEFWREILQPRKFRVNPLPIATVTVKTPAGDLPFQIFDDQACKDMMQSVLGGTAYPRIGFLNSVATIVDIGANIGAASVFFAAQYPPARIFAFEPAPQTFELLGRNVAALKNIRAFDFGLFDRDCELPLFLSRVDPVTNSVGASFLNTRDAVMIRLRNAATVLRELQVDAIDILKLDTEGCELAILRSIAHLLGRIQAIYLEFHDEADRIAMDEILKPTHILTRARIIHPHRGELCYVNYDSFPSGNELDALRIRSDTIGGGA
jgi:FkbM family methyltransferase